MSKIITAAQAAELVQDGCTLTTTGFNGFGCPEDLMMALADHFDQTSHPKDVTLVKCTSQGDGKGRGVSHLAEKPGLFQELILSHMGAGGKSLLLPAALGQSHGPLPGHRRGAAWRHRHHRHRDLCRPSQRRWQGQPKDQGSGKRDRLTDRAGRKRMSILSHFPH